MRFLHSHGVAPHGRFASTRPMDQMPPSHLQASLPAGARHSRHWLSQCRPDRLPAGPREDIHTAGYAVSDLACVPSEVHILDTMGNREAAQTLRWRTFEATLDGTILRDYLAHLPDFAEFKALDRTLAHAAGHAQRYRSS